MKPSEEVWEHHVRLKEALECLFHEVDRREATPTSRFFGMTRTEVEGALRELRAELDLQTTLALVASYEGAVRLDYVQRAKSNKTDATTRDLRNLWSQVDRKAELERILDAWRLTVEDRALGEFKQVLPYRHWLAPGRYALAVDQGTAGRARTRTPGAPAPAT